jgi:hypothetical protein
MESLPHALVVGLVARALSHTRSAGEAQAVEPLH